MIASIPRVQFTVTFFMNAVLICYVCSKVFELFHTFEEFITCLYVVIIVLHSLHETKTYA